MTYQRVPIGKPAPCPGRWDGLIGEYGWDHDVLYILEKDGQLHALIEWFFEYPLKEDGPDRFRFPDSGLYAGEGLIFTRDDKGRATQVEAAGVTFRRRPARRGRREDVPDHAATSGRSDPRGDHDSSFPRVSPVNFVSPSLSS